MEYPSVAVQKAVEAFKSLPGIGNKTAVRLVLHLIKQNQGKLREFESAVAGMRTDIKYCTTCHNLSDSDTCSVCANTRREHSRICVVQDVRDVLAIESTSQYTGVYHVLGGVISPMDGIGPDDLHIASLVKRVDEGEVDEVIFALSATMEGDTTIFYTSKQLKNKKVKISTIAKGIAVGGELEYIDEITLGRSLLARVPFEI